MAIRPKNASHQTIVKPVDVLIRNEGVVKYLDTVDCQGRKVGDAKCGIYAFYDYDAEPIYIGQTSRKVRVAIRQHLINHRTDAVAMHVLDPFEVAEIEVWPLFDLAVKPKHEITEMLEAAEYTVYTRVLQASALGAVLNEKDIPPTQLIELPPSVRCKIVPAEVWENRAHPDIRIARRANTIALLAKVVSERDVSLGLRRTLVTQARRLEKLAKERYDAFVAAGAKVPVEHPGEETGERQEGSEE